MSPSNPFSAPTADVADTISAEELQVPRVFSPSGRIGRLRFFVYNEVFFLAYLMIVGIGAMLGIIGGQGIVAVMMLCCVFCIFKCIQRSHDMGWSGWTVIFIVLIPPAILIWLLKAGTPESNDYGAPPIPNSTAIKISAWIFPILYFLVLLLF